jgi:WD40 repeat protein
VAFSPHSDRVVTASTDNTARVWDAENGQPLTRPLQHDGAVTDAAFSPDGDRVVTASADSTAQVWDATTGRRLAPPLRHPDDVMSAAFSGNGEQVVTTSLDRTTRVWTLAVDAGSLDDWRQLAGCGPFALAGAVLVRNPSPAAMCQHRSASSPASRR